MNIYVQQSITIQFLKVEVSQILPFYKLEVQESLNQLLNLYNTGGFTGPAPQIQGQFPLLLDFTQTAPLVPLTSPSR